MNARQQELHQSMMKGHESTETRNGEVWGEVYLDNFAAKYENKHQFAGDLSALKESGVYRGIDGDFGMVKLAA